MNNFDSPEELKRYINENKLQGHICISNNRLFPASVEHGIYGFPHAGRIGTKSYWRAVSSLNNIGNNDILFFHRTSGGNPGCKEIHGPFQIESSDDEPCIFYDRTDTNPIVIEGTTDCPARLLFKPILANYYSISDNYELIKKFETKKIWGLRHPSVMNIGAAQKKSIAAITYKQTIELIDLLFSSEYGTIRGNYDNNIPPTQQTKQYYDNSIVTSTIDDMFLLNDNYLETFLSNCSSSIPDEAALYSYILRAIKYQNSSFRDNLLMDFQAINQELLENTEIDNFEELAANAILELVPSPHLQETVDIMLTDIGENVILILEIKKDEITHDAIIQTSKYLDLFKGIFPDKLIFGNIIGSGIERGVDIPAEFRNQLRMIEYHIDDNRLRFQ